MGSVSPSTYIRVLKRYVCMCIAYSVSCYYVLHLLRAQHEASNCKTSTLRGLTTVGERLILHTLLPLERMRLTRIALTVQAEPADTLRRLDHSRGQPLPTQGTTVGGRGTQHTPCRPTKSSLPFPEIQIPILGYPVRRRARRLRDSRGSV